MVIPEILAKSFDAVLSDTLADPTLDKAMVSQLLSLPNESFLIEQAELADVDGIHQAREFLVNTLASRLEDQIGQVYESNLSDAEFSVDAASIAQRSLKNLALVYLVRTRAEKWIRRCYQQFCDASNMTDQQAALRILVNSETDLGQQLAQQALASFFEQWRHEPLVMDQWFVVQASCQLPNTLDKVKLLLDHPEFNIKNPNKVRSLIGVFCAQNHVNFHGIDGAGYEFLAKQVLAIDKLNPQVASRLLIPLTRWHKFDEARRKLMQAQLQRIKAEPSLSKDSFEIVEKSTP